LNIRQSTLSRRLRRRRREEDPHRRHHAAALPGPNSALGLFTNIQQNPREIRKAQADWVIADSGGTAKVIVTSHNEFAIAETKSRATEARLKQCPGCQARTAHSVPSAAWRPKTDVP
jgi:ribose transport system substrate-binding protein